MLAEAFNPVQAAREAAADIRAGRALGPGSVRAARNAVGSLPDAVQVIPEIQVAVRRASRAAGIAAGAGALGNVGDLEGLGLPGVKDLPVIGDPPSAVER